MDGGTLPQLLASKEPGVGVTKAPFVNFSVSKISALSKLKSTSYIIWITFIFDMWHSSWAAATPVKYKRDIQ